MNISDSMFDVYFDTHRLFSATSIVCTGDTPSNQSYIGYHAYVVPDAPELVNVLSGYKLPDKTILDTILTDNQWRTVRLNNTSRYNSMIGHIRVSDGRLYLSGDQCTVKHIPSGFTIPLRDYREIKMCSSKWLPHVEFVLNHIVLDKKGEIGTLDIYYFFKKLYPSIKYYELSQFLGRDYGKYKQKNKKKFVGIKLVNIPSYLGHVDYTWIKGIIHEENKDNIL
jgi:hypothetical protein